MKTVYLAGPDVFYPDARARGRAMQALCRAFGCEGLYPLDAAVPAEGGALSHAIYTANRAMIDRADAVVANLRDFRGHEPDSGTVWEAAYALARGKPVVGYLPGPQSLLERMGLPAGVAQDAEACAVEDFGLPLNLMLAHSLTAVVHGPEAGHQGLQAALAALARHWAAPSGRGQACG